jgi:hypothetical protein
MKYIIFEDKCGIVRLIVFDIFMNHSEMADHFPQWTVLSAGNFKCSNESISCIAKSVSLGIKYDSKQSSDDTELVKRFNNMD